jgi:hypothetical protein
MAMTRLRWHHPPSTSCRIVVLAALLTLSSFVARAAVNPPPLPPGSSMVRVEGGLDEGEKARALRAHHHKFHFRKDYTRDDSIPGNGAEEGGFKRGAEASTVTVTLNTGAASPVQGGRAATSVSEVEPCDGARQPGSKRSKAKNVKSEINKSGRNPVIPGAQVKSMCDLKTAARSRQKSPRLMRHMSGNKSISGRNHE